MTAPRVTAGTVMALAGAAALAVTAGWLCTVSLQQDFAAYHTAARARAAGLDPYANHVAAGGPWDGVAVYRHSRFLYPPLVADLFRPLAALPYAWAKALFTAASVLGLALALRLLRTDDETAVPPGALLIAAAWPPVFTALERGQIDLLLFPLLAAAWRWRARPLLAGAALASCALGKPFIVGLLPLLLVARRTRWAAATAAALALLALASVALQGWSLNREYVTEVLPRVARWGEGGPEAWLLDEPALATVSDPLENGWARIDGRTYAQQVGEFRRNASLPRALAGDAPPAVATTLALALAGGALLAWAARRRTGAPGWYWGGLLLGVVAAPVSWAMSLVWTLPVVIGWRHVAGADQRPRLVALAVTCGAGLLGPWLPGAWAATGVAGVAAAALWPPPERRSPAAALRPPPGPRSPAALWPPPGPR